MNFRHCFIAVFFFAVPAAFGQTFPAGSIDSTKATFDTPLALLQSSSGWVYLCHFKSPSTYTLDVFGKNFKLAKEIGGHRFIALAGDDSGNAWVAGYDSLCCFRGDTEKSAVKFPNVVSLKCVSPTEIIMGTFTGIEKYNPTDSSVSDTGLSGRSIYGIAIDNSGMTWAVGLDFVAREESTGWVVQTKDDPNLRNLIAMVSPVGDTTFKQIRCVKIGAHQEVIIGGDNNLLAKYAGGGKWSDLSSSALNASFTSCAVIDSCVWTSTATAIIQFNLYSKKITQYSYALNGMMPPNYFCQLALSGMGGMTMFIASRNNVYKWTYGQTGVVQGRTFAFPITKAGGKTGVVYDLLGRQRFFAEHSFAPLGKLPAGVYAVKNPAKKKSLVLRK
ncbi:MAG TPA: hypothetical protein VMD74_05280 [Candidatus Methylomirabilis sp.]|nr:hypothetical protein [Candidatus Methylomirabilis sp.]